MEIFFNNLNIIEDHNRNNKHLYELGLTEDADLTYEEQKAIKTGAVKSTRVKRSHASAPFNFNLIANFTAPKSGEINESSNSINF